MIETTYHITGCPCTLALLADSHNRPAAPILSSLRTHRPDLILIAGDFVYGNAPEDGTLKMAESSNAMNLLAGCASLAPTFVSLGNHEWMLSPADLQMIESTGAVILDNTFTTTIINEKKIVVAGLTSARVTEYQSWRRTQPPSELYPKPTVGEEIRTSHSPQPDLSWLDDFCAADGYSDGYRVLMCHHPEYWPRIKEKNIEMVVSGHAHGGQWRVFNPFTKRWMGVWSPGQGLWPPYTSGVHEIRLIISRGVANTTVVPRINNPTEIVYVE